MEVFVIVFIQNPLIFNLKIIFTSDIKDKFLVILIFSY